MAVYDDTSISMLIGADRVRKKPASMLGSSGLDGARHGFTEIWGNSVDEVTSGYGTRLDVHYYADGSLSVRDYGRGVPLGWNERYQNWNWHNIYNELYGGGKYDTNQEKLAQIKDWAHEFNAKDFNYLYSVGLNGLGAASTQYTSEFFTVRSYRGGVCTSRSFAKGIPLVDGKPFDMFKATLEEIKNLPEEVCGTDEADGTFIHWKPDIEVFDAVDFGGDWLFGVCKDISGIAGVTLYFKDDNTGRDVVLESSGILGVVREHAGDQMMLDDAGNPVVFMAHNFDHGTIKVEGKPFIWVCEADVAFVLTKGKVNTACYHNSVRKKFGVQYDAVNDAIGAFLRDKVKAAGVKLDSRDFDTSFGVVVSSYSNYASVRGQTKDAVDDLFIYNVIHAAMLDKLNVEYGKGNPHIKALVDRVITEALNRKAAADFLKLQREHDKIKKIRNPEKFVSCDAFENKQYDKAELWITEGDSASGVVKSARNKAFQAVYPIRGKGLNVLKAGIDRILKNKEIVELFALIGTGMDLNTKGDVKTFNIADLRFDKIIFATDADEDGYQIRVLLFLIFYRLAPQLIEEGHVYIAETPRFRINFSDGTHVYVRNDAERDKVLVGNQGRIMSVARYKGLGEVDADILRETTVHPDTRNLVPVSCNLRSETERELIDALFGVDKYHQRKRIITEVLGIGVAEMLLDDGLIIEDNNGDDATEEEGA